MSATKNDAAAVNSQGSSGEFHSSRPADEPLTTHGHQPGRVVSEEDAAPEFHAQTLPAGSAPSDKTFQPNNIADIPGAGASNKQSTASASETLGGATSGDVHTGLGHPGQGQTSSELRHDGKQHGGNSLEGVGAGGVQGRGTVNPHDPNFANQRALDNENATTSRSDVPSATERHNETAH